MTTHAIATSRNNNGPYSQHINKPIMRQQKEQQQATKSFNSNKWRGAGNNNKPKFNKHTNNNRETRDNE